MERAKGEQESKRVCLSVCSFAENVAFSFNFDKIGGILIPGAYCLHHQGNRQHPKR
jgi:hypothetical protein